MSCSNNTKKTDLKWTIERTKQIALLRKEDVQIYKNGIFYEIEFPLNDNRDNIIEIIRWQDQEQKI